MGTKLGVPNLWEILNKKKIKATFFFTVGPDNMGRHFWRLIKPKFLFKMFRINPFKIYGLNILRSGFIGKGKNIGKICKNEIKSASKDHEIGLHAWDHFSWQTWINMFSKKKIIKHINLGKNALQHIIKYPVTCFASPGWRTNEYVLRTLKNNFNFSYNSDCRGSNLFFPYLGDGKIGSLQIPVTLPTFDEVINIKTTIKKYNSFIIKLIKTQLNFSVYTIHAEIEGMKYKKEFEEFLNIAINEGINFCRLKDLIPKEIENIPIYKINHKTIPGRDGWIAYQQKIIK
ncbi:b2256 [Wigglesworthia glossinidia endosymbiont of Glossina brevipalpis]|uniref:Probable 4-deoxy-4-formamido-L-arabinose-phosphoundecaprenol deformylase ArnD n=1 Tax=Wigglesworthia glossinidia brevipalpis TaxID=36870 RepID=ARND_WIGBR|nr:RecName: Full=Probable 4-deoxy-4-formamido-L-arabinose-phosphoundecaprenol deformylase ArnD [Wigglesworthia glossinidia endosymbiont of Glossina brevipalpis]BAC24307.1 b2256 [Wigglesworthia glossinidia endosymbiont of Glossina brevipalpis]